MRPRTPSDRRICWDCGLRRIFPGVDNIYAVDRAVRAEGWRYLEPEGRMMCRFCAQARASIAAQLAGGEHYLSDEELEDLPF